MQELYWENIDPRPPSAMRSAKEDLGLIFSQYSLVYGIYKIYEEYFEADISSIALGFLLETYRLRRRASDLYRSSKLVKLLFQALREFHLFILFVQ